MLNKDRFTRSLFCLLFLSPWVFILRPVVTPYPAQAAPPKPRTVQYAVVGLKNGKFVLNDFKDESTELASAYGVQLAISTYTATGWRLHSVIPVVGGTVQNGGMMPYAIPNTSYMVILEK